MALVVPENRLRFKSFSKIGRLKRNAVVTEKIDGTNAHLFITKMGEGDSLEGIASPIAAQGDLVMLAGSRNRYLDTHSDNFGFANWATANAPTLFKLGEGRHFGEWWGLGIQRRYNMCQKVFSLFNVNRWIEQYTAEDRCALEGVGVRSVPVLDEGIFTDTLVDGCLERLRKNGSAAAPGFMDPEGVVVYHTATGQLFKRTLENDDVPKTLVEA